MKKKTTSLGMKLVAFLAMLMLFCIPVSAGVKETAGEYEIYPTPQEITYGDKEMQLTDQVKLSIGSDIDDYTKTRITDTLNVLKLTGNESAASDKTELIVGVYGSGDAADTYGKANGAVQATFDNYDAYMLYVKDGKIVVLGKDTDAAFYGVTTLKRIFEQLSADKKIKELTVTDYAEVQFRGFIEGYYGNPWSLEDRIDLMKFGGEIKMNQYVFAPKDDPYHNKQWRELYPKEDLEKIKKLAQAGNESKCFFVYALHTFMNSPFNFNNYDADLATVKAKYLQVIESGVRQIALMEDDATGSSAANLSRLLNDLTNWLTELKNTKYPDLKTDILYCPTDYMGNGSSAKLKGINASANRQVHMLMTGNAVWGQVSANFADNFYNNVASNGVAGRYPYMWVNWPCNDNYKTGLIMGGHNTILHTGIDGHKYEGIILNPMQHSEPSKVAIFTAADYSWKPWDATEEGDQAWEDSFKYIDHVTALESDSSTALREVAKHMIYQGPVQTAGRQAKFEESVDLKNKLAEIQKKVEAGTVTTAELNDMRNEFKTIYDAAVKYLTDGTNKRLSEQMTPFLECLRDECEADIELMDALKAVQTKENDKVWEHYSAAQTLYERSQTYGFRYVNETKYATAGLLYIVPFTEKVMKNVSDTVKQIIDPEHIKLERTLIYRVGGTENSGNTGNAANAIDGNLNTNFQIQTDQQTGDYVGLLFNQMTPVKKMTVALACSGHENDYIPNGVMEYTTDGSSWTAFETQPAAGSTTDVTLELAEAKEIKGFRWKNSNNDRNRWLIIREISCDAFEKDGNSEAADNKYTGTISYTSGWSLYQSGSYPLSNVTDGDDSTFTWFKPASNDTSVAGDYIQMDLGEAKEVYKVRIVTGAGSADKWIKYHLEYSEDGNSWTSKSAQTGTANGTDTYEEDLKGASARYIKLVNNEDRHNRIKFNEFSVCGKEAEVTGDVMDYTNTNDENWKVTYGDEVSKVYARDNVTLKAGQYIGLKLDRIHAIASIDTEGNGTDKLTLQTSLNQKEWTDSTSAKSARYIRLINNGSTDVTFSLSKFEVTNDEIGAMDLFETNIGGASNSEDARKLGTTANWMDGDLTSKAKYCATPAKDDYITYTLGQEITLKSLKVYVLDTAIDYPRDAVIQASVDNKTWTDLIKIGDGIENDGTDRDTKPAENGWTHDTVDVAYSYVENANINNVKAKYIRLYFNAGYSARWVELNEIQINGGAYIPTVNDPTFETDAALQRGQEPWNLNDGDLTTAFVPDMTDKTEGSLVYHLSDATNVRKLNIVQKSISNATVSVRIDENNWVTLGTLNKSLTTFYTYMYDQVLDVKLTWGDVKPAICEIITLQVPKQTDDELKQEVEQNLSAAIASAESIYTAGNVDKTYTDASWSAFETAYKNATTVDKTTATANEIQTLTSALQDAKKNLKNVAMEEAEKALAAAIADVKNIYDAGNTGDENYTSDSWKLFKDAYKAATAPASNATADDLKTLAENLQKAKANLKDAKVAAKEALAAAVNSAEYKDIYDAGNADETYTSDSWKVFADAYDAAKAPAEDATVTKLGELLTDLQNAKANLKDAKVAAKEVLTAAVNSAEYKDIYEAGNADETYTSDSWNEFVSAYNAAKAPAGDATLSTLRELLSNLQDAKANLKDAKVAAKEVLTAAVNSAEYKDIYDAGNADETYTSDSWKVFADAYDAAKAPAEDAALSTLRELLSNLQDAKANLKYAAVEAAKTALKNETENAETKSIYEAGNANATYTSESWTAFVTAYNNAKNAKADATAEELQSLLTALQSAKANLKKADTQTTDTSKQPDTPSTPSTPSNPGQTAVKETVNKNVTYRILNENKKTAAVIGVGGSKGKNLTSVTIARTVKIGNVTYKVTRISKNAFKSCKKLKKVTIGSNVKKIEKNAFAGCSKLKTVNMKKATGITSIGSKDIQQDRCKSKSDRTGQEAFQV